MRNTIRDVRVESNHHLGEAVDRHPASTWPPFSVPQASKVPGAREEELRRRATVTGTSKYPNRGSGDLVVTVRATGLTIG